MLHTLSCWLVLLLTGGLVAAQPLPPAPGINRNPAYREQLPPNPVPPPDERDTVLPQPGPDDPRDSVSRPVLPPASRDEADTWLPPPTRTGPLDPLPRPSDTPRR